MIRSRVRQAAHAGHLSLLATVIVIGMFLLDPYAGSASKIVVDHTGALSAVEARTSWHFAPLAGVHVPVTLILFNPNQGPLRVWSRATATNSVQLWYTDVPSAGSRAVSLVPQRASATVTLVADAKFIPSRFGDGKGGSQLSFALPGSIKRPPTMAPMPHLTWRFSAVRTAVRVSLNVNNPNNTDVQVLITFPKRTQAAPLTVTLPPGRVTTVDLTRVRPTLALYPLQLGASRDIVPARTVFGTSGSVSTFGIPAHHQKP